MSPLAKVSDALTKRGTYNWPDAILTACLVVMAIAVFITGMALLFGLPGSAT